MAHEGKKVSVHYIGTLDNGEEFDNSFKRDEPIEFRVGEGMVIEGFDEAVKSMEVGEKKTVAIPPAQAYGEFDPEALVEMPLEDSPMAEEVKRRVGKPIMMSGDEGFQQAIIKEIKDDGKIVVLDFNHPLAGQTLNFELTLVSVEE
jgi:FKBP-type peptidyl-prolyl cis-trans isomerase 2